MSEATTIGEELATPAAKWWADHFRTGVEFDNGDAMAGALASLAHEKTHGDLDSTTVDRFESELSKRIAEIEPVGNTHTIRVDYHPDAVLAEAAEAAGMDVGMSTFPWKTTMVIEPARILVQGSDGLEPIFTTEDWPPTVTELNVDGGRVEVSLYENAEEYGLRSEIRDAIPTGEMNAVNQFCVRELGGFSIENTEPFVNDYGSDRVRATIRIEDMTLFVRTDADDRYEVPETTEDIAAWVLESYPNIIEADEMSVQRVTTTEAW